MTFKILLVRQRKSIGQKLKKRGVGEEGTRHRHSKIRLAAHFTTRLIKKKSPNPCHLRFIDTHIKLFSAAGRRLCRGSGWGPADCG